MSLDNLRSRINSMGATAEDRLISGKLKNAKKALQYSYQAETIVLNDVEQRALLNSNKLKMDYDDKIISIPFESNIKVGDLFYWGRTKEYWIVYLREFSEDAYFRGYVRKAQHALKWKNEYGKDLEVFVAVRGPVETKIKTEQKAGLSYDVPNYTLSIIAPNNDYTSDLRRYSKVSLDGEEWEVAVSDRISEVGVIDLQLVERLSNKDTENLKPKIEVKTTIDNISYIELGKPINIDYEVYVDGNKNEALKKNVRIEIVTSSKTVFKNNHLLVESSGEVDLIITVEKTDYNRTHSLQTVETIPVSEEALVIDGSEKVKSYGTTTYTASLIKDGEVLKPTGTWKISGSEIYTIKEQGENTIILAWKTGMIGKIEISYERDGSRTIKNVQVTSLL